jgi:serine/threonine protein kinase
MKYCPQCNQRYEDNQRFCLNDSAWLSLPDPYRLVSSTLAEKYRIDALIGVGGVGAVYSTHHLGIGKQIAFKILLPHLALQNPLVIPLFEREAVMAARLSHDNIVQILDAGRIDDISYIAMEWLEGHTLEEEIKKAGNLTLERVQELLRQITDALQEAHDKMVIHLDLKPENVMLVKKRGGDERVKLVDFGSGKVMSSMNGTRISVFAGTPQYASPEYLTDDPDVLIDARSDIYSLGVMLFRMLTGKLPSFAPPLRQLRHDVPEALEQLITRMLAKSREARPQSVAEVQKFFAAAISPSEEVTIIRPKLPDRSRIVVPLKQPDVNSTLPNIITPSLQPVAPDRLVLKAFEFETVTVNDTGKIIERLEGQAQGFIEDLGNGVTLEMVRIPAGSF